MERRRVMLRFSLALNAILLGLSLYIAHRDNAPVFIYRHLSGKTGEDLATHRTLGEHSGSGSGVGDNVRLDDSDIDSSSKAITTETETCPPPIEAPCNICTSGPVGKKLCAEWGADRMNQVATFAGTNHRLRRALAKMRSGKPFTFASVGGSVSSGHGLYYYGPGGNTYAPTNMHRLFFDHLNRTFPAAAGSVFEKSGEGKQNAWVNSAQPARGSDYYSMCSHLDVPADVDLIVVELGINDPPDFNSVKTFELTIRSLLEYKNSPAVMIFNVFALMFETIAMGGELSHGVGQFYDVPTLSTLNAVLPMAYNDKSLLYDWFALNSDADRETLHGVDLRHFGPYLHGQSGDMMMAYAEQQMCEMDRLERKAGKAWKMDDLYPLDPLPPALLTEGKYNPNKPFPKLTPFCMATNSDKFPLKPSFQEGWRPWAWKDKKYLIADKPGSKLTFEFTTTQGRVILYFLRSGEFGLGKLACEIEGVKNTHKIVNGYWTEPFNIGRTDRWDGLAPGTYKLNCELMASTDDPKGRTEFRLMALMGI